jgi:hypothetical protein
MRHRLAVLTAVLALASLTACSHDKDDKPAPQAQGAVAGGSTAPLPGASAGLDVPPGASGTAPASSKPSAPVAGATATGPGHAKTTLPTGTVMSAEGIGPYAIGIAQAELSSSGLIGKVATDANGCGTGKGVRKYSTPGLVFTKGKLQHVKVYSDKIKTDKGVKVGTSYANVKGDYPNGKVLNDWVGAPAWYAVDGDNALLFRIKSDKVSAIEAGTASTLQFTYTDNQGC